jgi:lysylphosphatidylglycerol synthase-like protein
MSLRRFVPVALTAALIAAILYAFRGEIAVERVSARLAAVDVRYLALSIPFFLVAFAGGIYRNKFVIDRGTASNISFSYLFEVSNFSYVLGYLAPISIAAEVLRVGVIKKHLEISYAKSVRLVVIDKLLGFAGMALFSLLFIPLKLIFGLNRVLVATECLLLVGFFLMVPIVAHGGWLALRRVPGLGALATALREDWQFIVDNFSARRDFVTFLACSFLAVCGFAAGTVLVAAAMHIGGLALIFSVSPSILLVQNVPLFYAGFGAREAALLVMLENASATDPNLVLGFSLVVGIMLFVSAIPGALAFILRARR